MELNEKDINKLVVIGLGVLLAVLVFLLLRPVLLSIIGGLILAYVFYPIYSRILVRVRRRGVSAAIVTLLVVLIIFLPLWFLTPILVQQVFQMFVSFQGLDLSGFITTLFPTATDQFIVQTTTTFDSFVSQITSGILNLLVKLFLEFPTIILHAFLIGFVFFFTLRDWERLKQFATEISPFNKFQERSLTNQFKAITDSIIYGQVINGILQGIVAGIGLILFGVPNPLVLTLAAIVLGIIPVIGPGFVYVPVTIYLFATESPVLAAGYLAFNIVIVTFLVESILRTYMISKRSEVSAIVIFIGMIGGLFIFGILGIIIGPLVLSYFITLIKAYRDKSLGSLFRS